MTDKITCRGCQKSKKIPPTSNVGEMMSQSGYKVVMLSDTTILWICPECVLPLKPHIQAIADILGSGSLHWPHMLLLIEPPKPERKQGRQETGIEEVRPNKPDSDSVFASAVHIEETRTDAPDAAAAYSKMRSYDAGKAGDLGNKTLPMRGKRR